MSETDSQFEIAVLITCFNRRDTTLRCLRSLRSQVIPEKYRLHIFLTDDGCTDGTGDAVREEFPEVTVLKGDGNLYWAGGTRMAWDAARPAAFYLWLNDDVELRPSAIQTLVTAYEESADPSTIIVGATCDPKSGKTCTGGMIRKSWYDVRVIPPGDTVRECDTFNGNIVLVPIQAEHLVGGIDKAYTHFFADGDYGLRASRLGIPLLVAPGHLGECELNPLANSSFDGQISFRKRWKKMCGPKGYRPPRQWWAFVRSHAPRPKIIYWIVPYVLFCIEGLLGGKVRIRRHVRRPMKVS